MKFLLTLFVLLALSSAPALAQRVTQMPGMAPTPATEDHIAAVVNESVISTNDIEARMKLAFLASGLPDTPDVRAHILPQVLRGLLDEQLQLQEAKRLDITVPKEEIEKSLQGIASDNHIPGDIRSYLINRGASPEALEQQVRASIAWNKVVQRELRPRVEVGDDEIDAALARIRANAGKQEFLVSEIFLAVDNPKDEDQVHQAAEKLVQQIKGGANFQGVARQFSQSTGAAAGGDIGWIQEGQLPSELNSVLMSMQPGNISGPVRSANGYHILALREKRTVDPGEEGGEATLDLQQAFRPFGAADDHVIAEAEAKQLRAAATDCTTLAAKAKESFPNWSLQATNGMKPSQAPAMLADKIRDLNAGQSTEPMDASKGLLVVFVCARHTPAGKIDREAIASSIGTEKLELQARRLLRDLHRDAYIDIRMSAS